jgi:hypothetical protein
MGLIPDAAVMRFNFFDRGCLLLADSVAEVGGDQRLACSVESLG